MIKDNINKPSSSERNQTSESIPESSPAFLFCQKKSEINVQNENGWTPIYRSIISNDLGALKDLLDFGGDPNIANNIGETPIYLCVDTDNIEALKILLNNNPKPNCNLQKRNGDTALHLSFKKNKINFAQILLENNAEPNLLNKLYSQTATHLALINKINDENILLKLKENNADVYTIKDKYSKTAFDYAMEKGDENYVKLIKKIFGEKKQIHSLINNVSEDIKISINKSSNINKTGIDHLDNTNSQKNSLSSQNTDKKLNENKNNENNIGVNKLNNNMIYDKKKIKDIVVTTINKTVVSDISSNNKFSTPKEILTDSNLNTNSNMYTLEKGISSFLSNNSKINNLNNFINSSQFKKDIINETNPLDMMNQVIMSNSSNLYSTISQNKVSNNKSTGDKKEAGLNDSLELEKEKEKINEDNDESNNNNSNHNSNSNNKKEEVTEFKNTNNKLEKERHISYHNLNKNKDKDKDKIIPKLNLFNLRNSNKINNNNNNIKNNNPNNNNNNEVNHSSIKNKKRKSYTSLCSNLHYDTSTNPNTSMGSYFPNVLSNNIVSSIKNPETFNDNNNNHTKRNTSNYDDLTEENKYETLDNSKANNCLPYSKQNKTSNTSYKKTKKNVLTDVDVEPDVVEKQIEQNEENNAPMPNFYSLSRLRDWLISCDLISYYNLLKSNTSCNIEQFIQSMQENKNSITYRDIENLGIKKPGHIFRFLIKLQMDANIIDYNVHNKIINKFNNNVLTTIGLTASNNEIKCCGITLTLNDKDNNVFNNTNYYSDIFRFLKALNLSRFKENFIHNGFDQVDYIILQLFSEYKFDKAILNDFLHIYNDQDKKFVINTLYEEKNKIANELDIYYDENEKKEILKTFEKNDYNNDGCNIF